MKRYGIRITLTAENPMRLPHLLGEDWESFRWYESVAERDSAFETMVARLPNYRIGDTPAQVLTRVEESL